MSTLTKRAAARSVGYALVQHGRIDFSSKEAFDRAADMIGDGEAFANWDKLAADEVDTDAISMAMEQFQKISQFNYQNGHLADGTVKQAASLQLPDAAMFEAANLLDKLAAEAGSLIEGGDKGNTPEQAAAKDDIAALDKKQRPAGYAEDSRGTSAVKAPMIGTLKTVDTPPSESPAGGNSLTADKKAALQAYWAKRAGSLTEGGDKGNTPQQAASTNDIAALDQKQRPAGYAVVGQGNANFSEPQAARVGIEAPHPNGPSRTAPGTNSLIEASKAAAEEEALLTLISGIATKFASYFPPMSEEEMFDHCRYMAGMTENEKVAHVTALQERARTGGVESQLRDAARR